MNTESPEPLRITLDPEIYRVVEGVVDIHVHPNPDFAPRLLNDIELTRQAKAVGMRAIVIKCHASATADRAYIAEQAVGGGIEVYGIICLNTPVGGMNPEAVKMALRMGARGVWMPSMWAENHANYVREMGKRMGYETIKMNFPEHGETILSESGQIKPEVVEILGLVAEADVMLATGHLSVDESHLLLDEANKAGIKKLVVHTANYHVLDYPADDLKSMVAKGAILEFGFTSLPNPIFYPVIPDRQMDMDAHCSLIREVGPENCLLTSDTGQLTSPIQIECMRMWYEMLKVKGFTQEEFDLMAKIVPARILGLPPAG
jgi:hypothetical protein